MREEERQLGARDMSSAAVAAPATAPEMNFAHSQLSQTELNRIILDFLVTDGRMDIAEVFRQEAQLPDECKADQGLPERVEIRDRIVQGEVQSAMEQMNDTHPELLDGSEALHFHLLQQHLIELVRKGDTVEAVRFAQDFIAKKGSLSPAVLSELEQTLALLAFPKPQDCPFGDLLAQAQRDKTAREVNSALLRESGLRPSSQLESIVKLVLWCEEQLDRRSLDHTRLDGLFKHL